MKIIIMIFSITDEQSLQCICEKTMLENTNENKRMKHSLKTFFHLRNALLMHREIFISDTYFDCIFQLMHFKTGKTERFISKIIYDV